MKFRLEFVQSLADDPGYLGVAHSIQDMDGARKVIDMRVSPDAYESGTFTREPRRVEITLFINEWIRDYILSGEHEYERFISHYTLAVYRDEVLFFTGIIDTSAISYTQSDQIVTLVAYTPDRLLALFSDLEAQYSLSSGYTPAQLLNLHVTQIRQRVGVPMPINTMWYERPSMTININHSLVIGEFSIADLLYLPAAGFGVTYGIVEPWGPRWGYVYDPILGIMTFLMVQIVTIQAYSNGTPIKRFVRVRGRSARYFNHICGQVDEYEANTGWQDFGTAANDALAQSKNDLDAWLRTHGTTFAVIAGSPGLLHEYLLDDHGYSYDFSPDQWVRSTFFGRVVPQRFHPGTAVMEATSEKTNCLDVLKAVLYASHSTITSDANGALYLRSIPLPQVSGELVTIPPRDISEMTVSREDYESPGEGILDVFAGDTKLLEEQLDAWHDMLRAGRWTGEFLVTRPERYSLALGQAFAANGAQWMVISIEPHLAEDTKRIRAWKVLP